MELQSLGYIGIRARDVDEWADYGSKFLGLQLVDRSRSTLTFRMDDRRQRVMVHADGGEGAAFLGWEVNGPAALDALASRLEAAGGVERWSEMARSDPALQLDLERATAEQARILVALAAGRTGRDGGASLPSGIGGSHNPMQLKCLHAHVAFALAVPGYELGTRVLAEVDEPWQTPCCSAGLSD